MYQLTTVVLLLSVSLTPAATPPYVQSSVMLYKGNRLIGSGVVITYKDKPHVLTCKHVADEFKDYRTTYELQDGIFVPTVKQFTHAVTVKSRQGRVVSTRPGTIIKYAKHRPDLALIQLDDTTGLKPVPLLPIKHSLTPGETCWYCGAGNGVPFNLVKSIINDPDDMGWLRVNGEGWFGHSGSGILVKYKGKLHLAGVLWGTTRGDDLFKQPILCETHQTIQKFLDD